MVEGKKKILIVEDDHVLLSVLTKKLTLEGYQVVKAIDGEEALIVVRREHPDLILLDLLLPKKDGITVLRELRSDARGAKIPVIVLTNLSRVVTDKQIADHEIKDYLVKAEWDINEVIEKVKKELSQ